MGIFPSSRLNPKFIFKRFIDPIKSMIEINPSSYVESVGNNSITFNYNGKTYVMMLTGGYSDFIEGLKKVEYIISLYQEDNETYTVEVYWYDSSFLGLTSFDRSRIDIWFFKSVLPNIKNIITNEV